MLTKNKSRSKIMLLFLLASLAFISTGCVEKELVNDPATGEILPAENLQSLLDGRYTAATTYYDARGYAQQLDILIKNGIITQVDFKEVSKNATDRMTQEGQDKSWADLRSLNLGSLYFHLYNELILSQNSSEIETISGATQTSDRFIQLAEAAISQAKKGDHASIKINTTDTYTVVSQIDPDGFQGNLTATFNGPTLTNLTYDELRAEDGKSKRKSSDPTNNINFTVLFDTLIRDTLVNQTLDASFPENELPPEKIKYAECIRLLRGLRTPF